MASEHLSTDEKINTMYTDIALLKQAICGNGTKGLADRVEDLEDWKETHPNICPFVEKVKGRMARYAATVAGTAAVFTGLDVLGKLRGWW